MAKELLFSDADLARVRDIIDSVAVPMVAVMNRAGYPIVAVNALTLELLGYEDEHSMLWKTKGKFSACIFQDDLATSMRQVDEALADKGRYVISYRLIDSNNNSIWVNERGKLITLSNGLGVLMTAFTGDIALGDEQVRELEASRADAERANTAKTEFLARMSHDMRTPLNGIMGYTELALNETSLSAVRDCLSQISISGKFLLGLINDVLDVAKIESGKLILQNDVLSQEEFLSDIRAIITPLCEAKNLIFEIVEDSNPLPVIADKLRIEQLVFNLLSNAVKYTAEGGRVKLTIARFPSSRENAVGVRFVVSDTGIGMSEQYVNRAFDAFSREETGNSAITQGVGLGLSIVRMIVKAMRGTIKIDSKLNHGTRVVVHLILPMAASSVTDIEKPPRAFNLKGERILLAEDNDINAMVIFGLLSKEGVLVDRAENGQVALNMYMENEAGYYSAILMDVRMPVMDGIAATKIIRSLTRPDANEIPIIAVTANAFEKDIRDCLQCGMNDHVGKPVEPEKLLTVLSRFCNKK